MKISNDLGRTIFRTDISDGIMIVGDVHGHWPMLNKLIKQERPRLILQVGDFGYWPQTDYFGGPPMSAINLRGAEIVFCGGNHEHWWGLNSLKIGDLEVEKNIFYAPRNTVLYLPDGRNVLFMGGATSIDADIRILGHDWFPEETISYMDLVKLTKEKIDILICHTTPTEFTPLDDCIEVEDPSREALSYIVQENKPSLIYCGHWHYYAEGKIGDARIKCLDSISHRIRESVTWCWLRT